MVLEPLVEYGLGVQICARYLVYFYFYIELFLHVDDTNSREITLMVHIPHCVYNRDVLQVNTSALD